METVQCIHYKVFYNQNQKCQLQPTLVVNFLNIENYHECNYLKYAYLKCQLQARLVVNYPNIGRNFLLSADHRLAHYPQFPSQQM